MKSIPILLSTYLIIRIAALLLQVEHGVPIAIFTTIILLLIPERKRNNKNNQNNKAEKYKKAIQQFKQETHIQAEPQPVYEPVIIEEQTSQNGKNKESTRQKNTENEVEQSIQTKTKTKTKKQQTRIKWLVQPKQVKTMKIKKESPGESLLISPEKFIQEFSQPIAIVDTGKETKLILSETAKDAIKKAFKNSFEIMPVVEEPGET